MRKIDDSGKTLCSVSLSARAEARSRPNGFSTMTRASLAQPEVAEPLDHDAEEARRNRQVVHGTRGRAELLAQRPEGRRVVVVAVHVAQERQQLGERASSTPPPCARGCRGPGRGVAPGPARLRDPDHGHIEVAAPDHGVSAGKIFLWARSPVAPKKTSASDRGAGIGTSPRWGARGGRRTGSAWPTAPCWRNRPRRAR